MVGTGSGMTCPGFSLIALASNAGESSHTILDLQNTLKSYFALLCWVVDNIPVVTRYIMPGDSVPILVVEHCQACLIVPLLQPVHGQAHRVAHLVQFAGLQSLVVVGLGFLQPVSIRNKYRICTFASGPYSKHTCELLRLTLQCDSRRCSGWACRWVEAADCLHPPRTTRWHWWAGNARSHTLCP